MHIPWSFIGVAACCACSGVVSRSTSLFNRETIALTFWSVGALFISVSSLFNSASRLSFPLSDVSAAKPARGSAAAAAIARNTFVFIGASLSLFGRRLLPPVCFTRLRLYWPSLHLRWLSTLCQQIQRLNALALPQNAQNARHPRLSVSITETCRRLITRCFEITSERILCGPAAQISHA